MTTLTPATISTGTQVAASLGVVTSAQTSPCQITSAVFTNTDSSFHTVTVNLVRASAGGVSGPSNVLISAQPLAPGQAWVASPLSGRNLAAGDVLMASCDAAAVMNFVCDAVLIAA